MCVLLDRNKLIRVFAVVNRAVSTYVYCFSMDIIVGVMLKDWYVRWCYVPETPSNANRIDQECQLFGLLYLMSMNDDSPYSVRPITQYIRYPLEYDGTGLLWLRMESDIEDVWLLVVLQIPELFALNHRMSILHIPAMVIIKSTYHSTFLCNRHFTPDSSIITDAIPKSNHNLGMLIVMVI